MLLLCFKGFPWLKYGLPNLVCITSLAVEHDVGGEEEEEKKDKTPKPYKAMARPVSEDQ